MKKIFLQIVILIVAIPSYSQISRGGQPFTYDTVYQRKVEEQTRKRPEIRNVAVVADLDKAVEEERIEQLTGRCNSCRSGGKYYGKEMDVGVDFFSRALMTPMDNGEIWTLKIVSGKSEGFQFIFNDFYLPDGCLLFFYNDEKTMHLGAFTSANNRNDGHFITQHLNGNIAHVELFVPSDIKEQPRLFLDKVVYIFNNALRGPFSPYTPAEYCHINIACHQGVTWQQESKSVAIILLKSGIEYYGFCTGALINKAGNYENTEKPYFLTANHCHQQFSPRISTSSPVITFGYSDPKNWVFLFRHESNCNGSGVSNSLTKSASGATIIAKDINSSTSDYLLLELYNTVNDIAAFDISFAGWDKNEDPYRTGLAGIHHPNGDVKKISISNNMAESSQFMDSYITCAPGYHWRVEWSDGITATGSSGSPLFNINKQIIGFLTGGFSFCSDPDEPDYYGKFSKAFSSGNFGNYLGQNITSVSGYSPPVPPIPPDPPINYDLPLTIETVPDRVFIGVSTKVKVTASGYTTPLSWCIWVNKVQDDFNDYQCGDTNNCYWRSGSGNDGIFESYPMTFNTVGTYKAKVYAWDVNNRQSTVVFTIVVTESDNECVKAYIYQTQAPNKLKFAKGSTLSISEDCYVLIGVQSNHAVCFTDMFAGTWGPYYSKYHGIAKLEWLYDGILVTGATKTFNDVNGGAYNLFVSYPYPNPPINQVKYFPYSTQCFPLNESGIHTITLNAYGGKYTDLVPFTGYKYPFYVYGVHSTATMSIDVVDCDITHTLNNSNYTQNAPIDINEKGYITVQNVTMNSSYSINLKAYQSIIIEPGTDIQSNFDAQIEECPGVYVDCNNISTKSFNVDEYADIEISEPISNISIYPNPTREIINIDMNDLVSDILYYDIYDMSGRLLAKKIPENHIEKYQFQGQPNGLYLLRIVYKNCTEEVKKVILDQ